jgi:hypothetical protein
MRLSEKLHIKYPTIIGKRLATDKPNNGGRQMILNLAVYLMIFSSGILIGLNYSTTESKTETAIQMPDNEIINKDKEDGKDGDSTMVANK